MEKIIIAAKDQGQRIDKFLKKEFFLYSRGEIIRKIKAGEVLINGKKIKPSCILEENDEIVLENFSKDVDVSEINVASANKDVAVDVIFENSDFAAINKPAGMQVHPGFLKENNTLVNGLLAKYPEIKKVHDEGDESGMRPGIVHRLDKDTSGVLVVAKNQKTFDELKNKFKKREIQKIYLAIAEGILDDKEGKIEKAIARSSNYRKQVIARENTKTIVRQAETLYKVLEEHENFSLVEVMPKTGRMHQIRLHLSAIGHPVVGDRIYGKKDANNTLNKAKRQLLHAHILRFELFEKKYEFMASMPQDFKDFLQKKVAI